MKIGLCGTMSVGKTTLVNAGKYGFFLKVIILCIGKIFNGARF